MGTTININGLSLCHRESGGHSTATLPDVCFTPPGPVRVAYPNVATEQDLAHGTTTVLADGGNMCANSGSEFSQSTGDEPGTDGGVTSGTFAKEATWITFSFDVKLEGKGACRLTDKMFHNHQNTVNAGGKVHDPLPTMDCAAMWKAVDDEMKPIVDEPDHQKRNKMITEKYAAMHKRNPDYEWAGLAAVVSRQAGCKMIDAQKQRTSAVAGGDDAPIMKGLAKDGYDALGEANRNIFADIYKYHRFYELHGWEGIEQCGDFPGHEIPDMLREAFKKQEAAKGRSGVAKAATIRGASNKIAEYEQTVVVHKAVYTVDRYKNALAENELWSSGVLGPIGTQFGAQWPEVALSAECGAPGGLLFEGTINSPTDRVNFYHRLMDAWVQGRNADPSGWSGMYDRILAWARKRGGKP